MREMAMSKLIEDISLEFIGISPFTFILREVDDIIK
jgi:hypothetical protein